MLKTVVALTMTLAVIGCGASEEPNESEVKGTVTYAGEAVPIGTVSFVGDDVFTAPIQPDGSYVMNQSASKSGIPPGKYKVTVRAIEGDGEMDEDGNSSDGTWVVPEKYGDTKTSTLEVEVKDGANDIPLDLTD